MRKFKKYNIYSVSLILVITVVAGCKKFLDVGNPKDAIVASYAYSNENSAIAVASGVFYSIQANNSYGQGKEGISMNCGAAADELVAIDGSVPHAFYFNSGGERYWISLFADVYKCNIAIEGLEKSEKLSYVVKQQLIGEMKFTRAFLYFYLVNMFGDIPLMTTSNYAENSKILRSDKDKVYDQIKGDLKEAINLLSVKYVGPDVKTETVDRFRPNKSVAQALLSRVYLYTQDWSNAEATASLLINNAAYNLSPDLDGTFVKNSSEAIWQLDTYTGDFTGLYANTAEARYFVLDVPPNSNNNPVWISSYLESAFEPGDERSQKWLGRTNFTTGPNFIYPFKYKIDRPGQPQTETLMVLRISEQYLIRAEARINNNNIPGGINDLNELRAVRRSSPTVPVPSPLPALSTSLSLDEARLAVEHERQTELFTEWGHRWFDLKRTGRLDLIISTLVPVKGGPVWQSFMQYFPTPDRERRLNPNLGQTPGWPQ